MTPTTTGPHLDSRAAADETRNVYTRQAARFDAERPKKLHERAWLDRFTAHLPEGGTILDLGCGAGDPIAGYFIACGFRVTGLDASPQMLDLARQRFPDGDWRLGDMRDLDLAEYFDGICGWNSFFHLTKDEQRALLPRLAAHLAPAGALMLTVGPEASECLGRVGGEPVYHSSLSPDEYRTRLDAAGLDLLSELTEDPDCDFQTVLLARKQ